MLSDPSFSGSLLAAAKYDDEEHDDRFDAQPPTKASKRRSGHQRAVSGFNSNTLDSFISSIMNMDEDGMQSVESPPAEARKTLHRRHFSDPGSGLTMEAIAAFVEPSFQGITENMHTPTPADFMAALTPSLSGQLQQAEEAVHQQQKNDEELVQQDLMMQQQYHSLSSEYQQVQLSQLHVQQQHQLLQQQVSSQPQPADAFAPPVQVTSTQHQWQAELLAEQQRLAQKQWEISQQLLQLEAVQQQQQQAPLAPLPPSPPRTQARSHASLPFAAQPYPEAHQLQQQQQQHAQLLVLHQQQQQQQVQQQAAEQESLRQQQHQQQHHVLAQHALLAQQAQAQTQSQQQSSSQAQAQQHAFAPSPELLASLQQQQQQQHRALLQEQQQQQHALLAHQQAVEAQQQASLLAHQQNYFLHMQQQQWLQAQQQQAGHASPYVSPLLPPSVQQPNVSPMRMPCASPDPSAMSLPPQLTQQQQQPQLLTAAQQQQQQQQQQACNGFSALSASQINLQAIHSMVSAAPQPTANGVVHHVDQRTSSSRTPSPSRVPTPSLQNGSRSTSPLLTTATATATQSVSPPLHAQRNSDHSPEPSGSGSVTPPDGLVSNGGSRRSSASNRTFYKCSKCGKPKKGHTCAVSQPSAPYSLLQNGVKFLSARGPLTSRHLLQARLLMRRAQSMGDTMTAEAAMSAALASAFDASAKTEADGTADGAAEAAQA